MGLKSVKKILFYDGKVPIYHLYYGNDLGQESSLVTCFPVKHTGAKARRGSGQITYFSLSAPTSALPYWQERLRQHGFDVNATERFGEKCSDFKHSCGIDYSIVGIDDDTRAPRSDGPVPREMMLRGTHAICVSLRELEPMDEFMQMGWGGERVAEDRNYVRYQLGQGGTGTYIDFVIEPNLKAGSWTLGEGAVHPMALQIPKHAAQNSLKGFLEGLGFTDTSDVKDRGYFDSIYVRTPSGALFEATVSAYRTDNHPFRRNRARCARCALNWEGARRTGRGGRRLLSPAFRRALAVRLRNTGLYSAEITQKEHWRTKPNTTGETALDTCPRRITDSKPPQRMAW